MKTVKTVSTQFAKPREGFGIQGMDLKLNIVQCQVLNFHWNQIKGFMEENPVNEIPKEIIEPLMPFLALFKDFQNTHDPNLWVNEEIEQVNK